VDSIDDRLNPGIVAMAERLADAALEVSGIRRTDETRPEYKVTGIANKIFAGQPVVQSDLDLDVREQAATNAFESAFQLQRPWDWYPARTSDERTWRDFRAFLVKLYEADKNCFTKYFTWSRQPYVKGSMTALGIKRNPQDFPDSWSAFCTHQTAKGTSSQNRQAKNLAALQAMDFGD